MKRFILFLAVLVVFCLAEAGAQEAGSVKMQFVGASSVSAVPSPPDAPSYFFPAKTEPKPTSAYRNIYPGINLATYSDGYSTEYAFSMPRLTAPDLIRWRFIDSVIMSRLRAESLRLQSGDIEIMVSQPVVIAKKDGKEKVIPCLFSAGMEGTLGIDCGDLAGLLGERLNNTAMNFVPSGGQPSGPDYDFFVSKYEITNDQFVRFLNDAQADNSAPRGANMFFDDSGNVWFNPEARPGRDELFVLKNSRIVYDPAKPVGERYMLARDDSGNTPFSAHPVSGVSWFGAAKYCNWLTISSGRGINELCYTEGTNALDWAPVTATNWASNIFSDVERRALLAFKGFRLCMVNTNGFALTSNPYNEVFKAAAWHHYTNMSYGFGRNTCDPMDANFRAVSAKQPSSLPVGYYSSTNILAKEDVRPNENIYGLYDMSGNAGEWSSDLNFFGKFKGFSVTGGSYVELPSRNDRCMILPGETTSAALGFRIVTTYMPEYFVRIHVLVGFFESLPGAPAAKPSDIALVLGKAQEAPAPAGPAEAGPEEISEAELPARGIDISGSLSKTDFISPSGISYKEKPSVAGVAVPETGSPAAGAAAPPVLPGAGEVSHALPGAPPGPPPPVYSLIINSQPINGMPITGVTSDVNGNRNGNTAFTRFYVSGTSVSLTSPDPSGAYDFARWLLDGANYSVNTTITVAMNTNHTATAVYTPRAQAVLTVASSPGVGLAVIGVTPDINGNGDGSTVFTRTYLFGNTISATAPASSGINTFQRWLRNGAVYSTNRTISLVMNNNYTITAVYSYVPGPIPNPDPSPSNL